MSGYCTSKRIECVVWTIGYGWLKASMHESVNDGQSRLFSDCVNIFLTSIFGTKNFVFFIGSQ